MARRVNPTGKARTGRPLWQNAILIVLGVILTIALLWTAAYAAVKTTTTKQTVTVNQVVTTTRSVTGKSSDQDKQDAVKAAQNLLVLAGVSPTGKTDTERLTALDDNDTSVIDSRVPNLIRWAPEATTGLKSSTYETLIVLHATIASKDSSKTITPISSTAWESAYSDPQIGVVFVPIDIFLGTQNSFSMEMVYVDGQWKLAPYSLVDAVRLSSQISGTSTSSASAVATSTSSK